MSAVRRATIYPQDVAAQPGLDIINARTATTLDGLFRERVARTPAKIAYLQFCREQNHWREFSWAWMETQVATWQRALTADGFTRGDCAAIRMRNRHEWMIYDQACIAAGMIITPLYWEDRPDNIAYVLQHCGARLLLVETAGMWSEMKNDAAKLTQLKRVVILEDDGADVAALKDARVMWLRDWLAQQKDFAAPQNKSAGLATIVYTSGTTGKPKGVMLSHENILATAHAGLKSVSVFPHDKFLSFLPLSHMFERTVGYYSPMMAGASVAFNREIALLKDDLIAQQPSVMICVPRIFERANAAIKSDLARGPAWRRWLFDCAVTVGWRRFEIAQRRARWTPSQLFAPLLHALVAKKIRARFGGNLRYVISGGAPLAANISRLFIALGVDILQGYGLTETGPTLAVNTVTHNQPTAVGLPCIGTDLRISDTGELQARSAGVMLGYWQNAAATDECMDADGWFSTGDLAAIDDDGFVFITGRRKEIIVLATGEKVPPADMELAICDSPLFEQAIVVGEGRAFLSAVVVLDDGAGQQVADEKMLLAEIATHLKNFPSYAAVRRVYATTQLWTVENGALTPTLKIKRSMLMKKYETEIENLYRKKLE